MGFKGQRDVQDDQELDNNMEIDDFEYPSNGKLLSVCSSDDRCAYWYPKFNAEFGMNNPHFEVGQIFSSADEFKEEVREYDALNGYNVKY